jgi:hypothetical protein
MRWTRDVFVRVSGYWLVIVSFAAGISAPVLLHTWLWPSRQAPSSLSGNEIHLQVHPKGNRLLVQWNPQSLPVLQGDSGLLTVQDGGRQVRVPLGRRQLRAGSTSYTPTSEWAEFRLEIYHDGNHYSGEAMALSTGVRTKEKATPVRSPLVHNVHRPNSEMPLSAKSSNQSVRFGVRPFRGPTISPGVELPTLPATNTSGSPILEEHPSHISLVQNTAVSSPSGSRDLTIYPEVEEPRLRESSNPTRSGAINTSAQESLEKSPATIDPDQNNTALISRSDSQHPIWVPEVPLPSSKIGKLTFRKYDGIILDATCRTLTEVTVLDDQHKDCAILPRCLQYAWETAARFASIPWVTSELRMPSSRTDGWPRPLQARTFEPRLLAP